MVIIPFYRYESTGTEPRIDPPPPPPPGHICLRSNNTLRMSKPQHQRVHLAERCGDRWRALCGCVCSFQDTPRRGGNYEREVAGGGGEGTSDAEFLASVRGGGSDRRIWPLAGTIQTHHHHHHQHASKRSSSSSSTAKSTARHTPPHFCTTRQNILRWRDI